MWLGAWKERQDQPFGLTWICKMKILGVIFGTVQTEIDNWQPKINKLEKVLNLWKSRSLFFIGKVLIINVIGLSKFFYLARVLIVPTWILGRVNRVIWFFLWGTRIETGRRICCLPLHLGGLGTFFPKPKVPGPSAGLCFDNNQFTFLLFSCADTSSAIVLL